MKKVMSVRPGLNLVQSIFSCLAALKNPYGYMFWAKELLAIRRIFSLVDIITNTKFSNCPNVFKNCVVWQ